MAQQVPPQAQPRSLETILRDIHEQQDDVFCTTNYGDEDNLCNVPPGASPAGVLTLAELLTNTDHFTDCYSQVLGGVMACKDHKRLRLSSISTTLCVRVTPNNPDNRFNSQTALVDQDGMIGTAITYSSDESLTLGGFKTKFGRVWADLKLKLDDYDRIREAILALGHGNPDSVRLVVAVRVAAKLQCKWPGSYGSSSTGRPLA